MDVAFFGLSAVASALYSNSISKKKAPSAKEFTDRFPSIRCDRPLVGLLFAASWCDDCWETVPKVEKVAAKGKDDITIHYISSDRSVDEMSQYCNASVFVPAPAFDNEKERSALKRHFQTCAKKEMQQVGVKERKHGTPTLIVLDSKTLRTLTEAGVDDCVKHAGEEEKAIIQWKSLLL